MVGQITAKTRKSTSLKKGCCEKACCIHSESFDSLPASRRKIAACLRLARERKIDLLFVSWFGCLFATLSLFRSGEKLHVVLIVRS